jgi:hypothetical protein
VASAPRAPHQSSSRRCSPRHCSPATGSRPHVWWRPHRTARAARGARHARWRPHRSRAARRRSRTTRRRHARRATAHDATEALHSQHDRRERAQTREGCACSRRAPTRSARRAAPPPARATREARGALLGAPSHVRRPRSPLRGWREARGSTAPRRTPSAARRSTSRTYRASETPVHSPCTRLLEMPQRRSVVSTRSADAPLSPRPSTWPAAALLRCVSAAERERVGRSGAPGRGGANSSTASAHADSHPTVLAAGCFWQPRRPMLCMLARSACVPAKRPTHGERWTCERRMICAVPLACAAVRRIEGRHSFSSTIQTSRVRREPACASRLHIEKSLACPGPKPPPVTGAVRGRTNHTHIPRTSHHTLLTPGTLKEHGHRSKLESARTLATRPFGRASYPVPFRAGLAARGSSYGTGIGDSNRPPARRKPGDALVAARGGDGGTSIGGGADGGVKPRGDE